MADPHKITPWKTLSSEIAFPQKWFRVRKDTVRLPSGDVVDDYFVWEAPHIVMAVPVTPDGKFIVVRQYRHATNSIFLQFPAGAADKDESPEEAARRELLEETGYTGTHYTKLGSSAPYATKITDIMDIYLVTDAVLTQPPHADPQEEVAVETLTAKELMDTLTDGNPHPSDFFAAAFLALNHLKKM